MCHNWTPLNYVNGARTNEILFSSSSSNSCCSLWLIPCFYILVLLFFLNQSSLQRSLVRYWYRKMIVSGFNWKLRSYIRWSLKWRMSQISTIHRKMLQHYWRIWLCGDEKKRSERLLAHCMFKHWIPDMTCGLAAQLSWEYVSSSCHVVWVVKDSLGGPGEQLRSFLPLWHRISIPVTFFCSLIVLAL